ncbi:MAG: polyphosphate kinase 1 [Acidimicrobiales bacterium]
MAASMEQHDTVLGGSVAGGYDHNDTHFLNRELGWLAFNERVLAMVADPTFPLLERVRFCAICSSNLDEFFQVRVAGLDDQVAAGITSRTPDGRTPASQLAEIRDVVTMLTARQEALFQHELRPALAEADVVLANFDELDADEVRFVADLFERRIFPVLTPLAVDPGHPFPYISDLSLNLAVVVEDPADGERHFARLKVPDSLDRFVRLPGGHRYVPLEQVIVAHVDRLFPGMRMLEHHPFRVTRNGDLIFEDEAADDLLSLVEMELRRRRFGRAIRLEIHPTMSDHVRELLKRELDLDDEAIYETSAPLDLTCLFAIADLDRPELRLPSWSPIVEPELAPVGDDESVDVFAAMTRSDVLVHHPYTSFSDTVTEFIEQAADDPKVLAIKITLYRTSGDSPIIEALIRAAESGKQVAVLIELKARFDEQANITWAKRLEQVGVHVAYGLVGLKIHSKVCLVVRDEPDGLRRYCHIGTGNYNSRTARIYEDVGLLTARDDLGEDLTTLFNQLTGYGRGVVFNQLITAPDWLRDHFVELTRREMSAEHGHITAKMNALVDPHIIELLYEASQAGVQVDLLVRGICCLRPGVPGISDNIRVMSIIGRYLEHSRIYRFANGEGPDRPVHLIGSADLMPRNLDRRVEVLVPVRGSAQQARLDEILDTEVSNHGLRWDLDGDGRWVRQSQYDGDVHVRFQDVALRRRSGG